MKSLGSGIATLLLLRSAGLAAGDVGIVGSVLAGHDGEGGCDRFGAKVLSDLNAMARTSEVRSIA